MSSSRNAILKVGNLLLDTKNARIAPAHRSDNQRQLLHYLLEEESVKALARSIAKLGLFPNERIVVMPEGKRYVVLEGNRRVTAVKLLLNPELAPTRRQVTEFRKLALQTDLASLGRLEAVVVPDRLSAAPIIAALHTGQAKKKWSNLQQARFYRELAQEGLTVGEIADELGSSVSQVTGFLRAELLHRTALSLEYPDEIKSKIDNPDFPLTTLERFLDSKVGRTFLGIQVDGDSFVGKVHPERFKAVLTRVATDIATVKGLTRKINDEPGFKNYIAEVDPEIPQTPKRGSFMPGDIAPHLVASPREANPEPPPKPKLKRRTRESRSIVPTGFACRSNNKRVCAIFDELKQMILVDQRNSSGVMLRVLLDIALWSYIQEEGLVDEALAACDPKGKQIGRKNGWTPNLRDLISFGVEKKIFRGMTANGYQSVRSLVSRDTEYFITIDGFNAFTHNNYVTPTEADLRALWQRAEPMLEVILDAT